MQLVLLIVFLLAIIFLVQAKIVWLAGIVFLLLLLDLFGGVVSKFFGFVGAAAEATGEIVAEEAGEVEAAKTKYPHGKKFIDEGLGRIGKELGKKEKERDEKKKMKSKLNVANAVGAIDNFMMGFGKLFKK
ncbi:MAG TPA: hypothetical protein VJH23_00150 [archaeon]|nr:hypothetical protein [archaeon]